MAADRFLDTDGLRHLWEKIKAWIPFLSRKTQSIPFGQVDSTSTATVFTATVDGIDELRDGVCCYIRNGVVTSATGCTMNINGLGAKPMYYTTSSTGRVTSHFSINYTWLFIYNSTRVAGGCWDSYWGYNSEYNLSQNYIYIGRIDVGDYPTSAYSLGAFDVNDKWTPFVTTATTSTGKSLVQSVFPIGAKIYRDTVARSGNTSYNDVYLYTTLSNLDLRYSSVNHNQAIFPNYNFNRVFMPVIVNVANNTFTLTTQTTNGYTNNFTNERSLKADNFYIEIGFNSASTTSYYLTLICENNLYYYDGEKLIEYSIYKSSIVDVPEYTIEKLAQAETSYSASYVLKKDNVQVGATINIPKDMVVSSGEVKTVTTANVPYQGAQVGDKYIDLTIANTAQNHIYIPVKDLVDVYVAGSGINITSNNYISVKVDQNNANGLGVGGSGVSMYVVTPSINGVGGTNGSMLATDKEKLDGIEAGAEENVIETVKVSGTALQVTNKAVNIETETAYDPSTNKIATMSDVTGATPNVGHLKTNNTTAQTPSASESFTGNISLHKVAKTGSYNDLNDQPTIPSSGDFVTSLGTSDNYVTWTKNGVANNLTVPYATSASRLNITALSTGDDLNDYTTEGVYGTTITSVCASFVNAPTGRVNGEMRLEVISVANGNTSYVFQKYWARSSSGGWNLFIRTKNGSTWSSWVKNLNSGNGVSKVTSTDNAVARFDGAGGDLQNSGVTIDDLNKITAASFITSGGTSSQIVLGNGALASAKELPQYEAYLEWGGKNFSGSYGCLDAAMIGELGAIRTMFLKAAGIVIEYSTDAGTTWLDYEATDVQKVNLFSTGATGFTIGKATSSTASANNMLRVTMRTSAGRIYTVLNKFAIYVSTNGSQGTYCTIRCRTQENYENNVDTWVTRADHVSINGWSGWNVINITGTATYGNAKSTQYGEWQFIFGCTGHNAAAYAGLNVSKIYGFGGVGWSTPSTMAKTGHLYSFDASQNAIFPADVTASKFIKSGGTSSQFLKADGSVDNNTYATTSQLPSLPLSIANGGTGKTTAETAANALIGGLPTWTADPSDDVYLIRRDTGGSLSFGQVKFSTVWNYIKSKIASVLGIGGSNGVPTAPTAAAGTNTTQIATTAFVQSATNGMAIDTNVVHKTGNENVGGVKTFTNNVKVQDADVIFDTKEDEQFIIGIARLEQDVNNGIGGLRFYNQTFNQMPVLLRNVMTPMDSADAANKEYVDYSIFNIMGERVRFLSYTGEYGLAAYSLCAFAKTLNGMILTSFTTTSGTGQKSPVSYRFPIGCNIYFHNDTEGAYAGSTWTLFTSYRHVDARYTAITGTNISLGDQLTPSGKYYTSSVFLHVMIDGEYWIPYYKEGATTEILVSLNQLQTGNYYIYLGKTTQEIGDDPDKYFCLEDNNPLYYYDGTNLVDWATRLKAIIEWQSTQDMTAKADKVEEATNGNLAGLDYSGNLTDSGLAADEVATLGTNQLTNYYKKTEIYSKSETDALVRAASDFEYEEVSVLPTASASTKGKFYLYNGHRYVTTEKAGGVFSWTDLGSYDIDLDGYVTKSNFDTELAIRPSYERLDSEAQMQSMINNHTWVDGVIYYTVEED